MTLPAVFVTVFSVVIFLVPWIPGKNNGDMIAFCVLYGFSPDAFISLAQISPLPQLRVALSRLPLLSAILDGEELYSEPQNGMPSNFDSR